MTPPDPAAGHVLDESIVEQAVQWLVRLQAADTEANRAACLQWRQAHADHELAWQRFAALQQNIGAACRHLPAQVASQALLKVSAQVARRRAVKWLFGLAGTGVLVWQMRDQAMPRAWLAAYRTGAGERRQIALADGTRILLNTASALDVEYTASQSLLRLYAGEMLVTSGPGGAGKRLLVQTLHGTVRPVGTRFSVRQQEDDGKLVHVAVAEGMVALASELDPERTVMVGVGQQAWLRPGGVSDARPADVAQTLAWEHGMLVANRMRLDAFLQELARYRSGVVRCHPAVAGRLVTGTFRTEDTDQVLHTLASGLGLQIQYRTRYWVSVEPAGT